MKLGKLLSAGKSIFGISGARHYREDKRFFLPKFNAETNPFTPAAAAATPDSAKTQKLPELSTKTQKIPVVPAPRPVRAISWKDKLNPFRTPEPSAPSLVGAVQPELSLDSVKVVRNDLADADIEVVPVKSQTIATPEASAVSAARQPWQFMTEPLVKAD